MLALVASYCLLSTACLVCIILFWGGFLDEQAASCRDKARRGAPPVYVDSVRVFDDDDGDDADPGSRIHGYTTEAAFEDVRAFYEQEGAQCVTSSEEQAARCVLPGTDEAAYTVEIRAGDGQTLYQIIIRWDCRGTT